MKEWGFAIVICALVTIGIGALAILTAGTLFSVICAVGFLTGGVMTYLNIRSAIETDKAKQ